MTVSVCEHSVRNMAAVVLDGVHSFNDSGLLFSYCGGDGKLKIWDTSSGTLKQEFTKNLHLSTPCTCITWLRITKLPSTPTPKKKKLRKSQDVGDNAEVIAIGTTSGTILLYNVATNSVVSELEGHTSHVSHITWSKGTTNIYSCSHDKHIIEWDLISNKIKSKWKSGKEKINCILVLSNKKTLLTASCSIKLWDLEKKNVLRTFTGHATEVTTLIEVPDKEDYFISAAKGDRVVSAWSVSSKDKTTPVASFVLQDGASSVHMSSSRDNSTTSLCAVTDSGVLHIFKHKLNGNISKPLKPRTNVSIASESDNAKQSSHPIPIHDVLSFNNGNLIIAYGSPIFLSFETLSLNENKEENLVLIRQDKRKATVDVFNSKIKVPEVTAEAEYQLASAVPLKRSKGKRSEIPLEERLDNLALASTASSETPKKDNMAQLLIQGLQSKDRGILQNVLFRTEENIINSTVKNLPIQALVPLIRELTGFLHNKTLASKAAVRWLSSLLRNHSGIILSNPEVVNIFEPLLSSIEARVSVLPSLIRLKGRLNLVAEQIGNNMSEEAEEESSQQPLISYQEQDSSEEEEVDLMSEGSESDDNWDEFSDMDDDQDEEMDDK